MTVSVKEMLFRLCSALHVTRVFGTHIVAPLGKKTTPCVPFPLSQSTISVVLDSHLLTQHFNTNILSEIKITANESTNDRVKWFSVGEFIVLILTNVWQIYTIRQRFESRSRI